MPIGAWPSNACQQGRGLVVSPIGRPTRGRRTTLRVGRVFFRGLGSPESIWRCRRRRDRSAGKFCAAIAVDIRSRSEGRTVGVAERCERSSPRRCAIGGRVRVTAGFGGTAGLGLRRGSEVGLRRGLEGLRT